MQHSIALLLLATPALSLAAGTFSTGTLTGDADSGISSNHAYTHAINVGDAANSTINGAVFTGGGTPGTNNYTFGGVTSGFGGWGGALVSGATGGLFTNFQYQGAGGTETLTLNNLRIGQQYETTFYNAVWGGPRSQTVTTSDGGSIVFDPDAAGPVGTGSLLKYNFTATANTMTYTLTPGQVASFHQYAFSNRAVGYTALLTDNFFGPGNPDTNNVNFNLAARQGGSLVTSSGVKSWVDVGNTQVGNNTGGIDSGNYLLSAFGGNSALDYNFNGSASAGGLSISFDLAPNIGNVGADNWQAINLGAAFADKNGGVNGGQTHFGVLFRGDGRLQAFDGSSVLTLVEPLWSGGGFTTQLNHFELHLTDSVDGNPFDGIGQTTIDVYANGNPVYSFTKGGGGYADNYINFQASHIGGIDNLVIANMVPEPGTTALAALAGLSLLRRRRR